MSRPAENCQNPWKNNCRNVNIEVYIVHERQQLPICTHCKKIRDDKGYWNQLESYIEKHSDAVFTHGICKECIEKLYPDLNIYDGAEDSEE